jgi:hypothetical protein
MTNVATRPAIPLIPNTPSIVESGSILEDPVRKYHSYEKDQYFLPNYPVKSSRHMLLFLPVSPSILRLKRPNKIALIYKTRYWRASWADLALPH